MSATKGTGPAFEWGGSATTTTAGTSAALSVAGDYAATVFLRIGVDSGTTAGPSAQVLESPDGTKFYSPAAGVFAPGAVPGTFDARIPLDPTTRAVEITFSPGTGAPGSCSAQLGELQG